MVANKDKTNKTVLDLTGKWEIVLDEKEEMEQSGIMFANISPEWKDIQVPAYWQEEGFDYQGVVWYRKEFSFTPEKLKDDQKLFIIFGGVDYLSEVWLNGVYLGNHEGAFDSFEFEVSNIIRKKNELLIKVESKIDSEPEFKEILKGGNYHWDCLPIIQQGLDECPEVPSATNSRYPNPVINPGGIWKSVSLVATTCTLEEIKLTPCFEDDYDKVSLNVKAQIYNHLEKTITAGGRIGLKPKNFSGANYNKEIELTLEPGLNFLDISLNLDNPALWWTWDMGDPNLYQFRLQLSTTGQKLIDYKFQYGLREVKKGDDWQLYLNGKRFFARGTNYLSDHFLSRMTEKKYDQDLEMMLTANMNMIRLFSHQENEYFYEQCDRRGILIWQDLPFQWGYRSDPYLVQKAKNLTERFVNTLYNHASIFLWCCHSESRYHDFNKLDRVLENTVRSLDKSRPVWRNSVIASSDNPPESFADIDQFADYVYDHLSVHWVGWYWDSVANAEEYNPYFVTEFGSQSVPALDSLQRFMPEGSIWPPDREEWEYHCFQFDVFEKNLGEIPESIEGLIDVSQKYQQYFYKQHIEALRRKKYNNVNGLLQFHFVNPWPAIDWAMIDYYRNPKKAYFTVQNCFQPLLISFAGEFADQQLKTIKCWIINDYHQCFNDLTLEFEVKSGENKLAQKNVPVQEIKADSVDIYFEEKLSEPVREVIVSGTLYQGDKVLSGNQNILKKIKSDNLLQGVKNAIIQEE